MSNVKIAIRTLIHESINLKATLRDCFNDESRWVGFRAKTAANSLKHMRQVKAARTGYLSL